MNKVCSCTNFCQERKTNVVCVDPVAPLPVAHRVWQDQRAVVAGRAVLFCFMGGGQKSIYIKEACLSVCLFVCLFGFGAQTTGRIPTKFGMDLPLDPVGYLKTLFWVDSPQGGIILEKLKNLNFPHMAQDGGRHPFAEPLAQFFEVFFLGGGFGYFFEWAERSEASQRVSQPTGAKQPATS